VKIQPEMDRPLSPATPLARKRFGLMIVIVSLVVFLDQLTKWQVVQSMRLHESIPLIADNFSLTYIRNSGAAFGILAGSQAGFRMIFFGITSVLALILLGTIYARLSPQDWVGQASVALIFGGALGNLIDRVRFGEVIDFLDFSISDYHWPAFNIADSAITIGVALLIGHFFLQRPPHPHPVPASGEREG
jgi:signal peptidase II